MNKKWNNGENQRFMQNIKLEKTDRPNRIATFIDPVGEERQIVIGHNRRLRVKNEQDSLTAIMATSASRLIGQKIRWVRQSVPMTAEELGEGIGMNGGTPKNQICNIEKQFRRHGMKTGTIYAIVCALNLRLPLSHQIQPSNLIPTTREVLAGIEDALDWKDQKLGFRRWNIINEWRKLNELKPLDKKYLYSPDIQGE
jgi:hypothetical protein